MSQLEEKVVTSIKLAPKLASFTKISKIVELLPLDFYFFYYI